MVSIGRIPRKTQGFFKGIAGHFSARAFRHFWGLVLAMTISHGSTIDRLARLLRGSTHRTNHGEFLWRSDWSESDVLQQVALETLRRLHRKNARPCYLIIDETQTLKRAKKMSGVRKLYHHATGKYGTGHTMVKACLYYRGVTIPWSTALCLCKEDARKEDEVFLTQTALAAYVIHTADLPRNLKVTVLFDSYYLCDVVADACRARGWHYIGVGKSNRNFIVDGQKKKLDKYGRNVLARDGQWRNVPGLRKSGMYRLASRVGFMKKLGEVKVVFSRRRNERKIVALVTDDLRASLTSVVADYLKRWAIELLIKDQKQQLGLGDYRVLRYRAVVRHLHLVDIAYACLTRLALDGQDEQGRHKNDKVLRLPPISQLKARMRQIVWQEALEDVVKHSHEKLVLRRLERLLAA
ncbi:MAG TPA: transposase [Phycisphaerae bacterium]|nr:transposase [Phycisphaerae bacterium]